MKYPCIVVRVPHQLPPKVYQLWDGDDLYTLAIHLKSDIFESDYPEGSEEWCIDILYHDQNSVDFIESHDDWITWLETCARKHNRTKALRAVREAVEEMWA